MNITTKMVVNELKYQSTTVFALIETHQVDVDKREISRNKKKKNFNFYHIWHFFQISFFPACLFPFISYGYV